MRLNIVEDANSTNYKCPERLLRLKKKEYVLGAVRYGDGAHFCCHVCIKGGVLFHHGIKQKNWFGSIPSRTIFPEVTRLTSSGAFSDKQWMCARKSRRLCL
jgi:hypothetical protein